MSQYNPNQYPSNQPSYQSFGAPPPRKPTNNNWIWILLGILGFIVAAAVFCCGGAFLYIRSFNAPLAVSSAASEPFQVSLIPAPVMPELGDWEPLEELPGAKVYHVQWGPEQYTIPSQPGVGGEMYVLLPPGEHAPGSIPCLLAPPAGTNLMTGAHTGPYFDSHLPYLMAGFAIMDYELDGAPEYETEQGDATTAFIDSQAGLVNSRNVINFVLQKMPMVNPKQIFAVGHSSAGSHALLLGEHDNRIAGVVAYAAACNIPKRIPPFMARLLASKEKRLGDFLTQSSPHTHATRMNCPVLLCHAEDDSNVPVSDSREMHAALQAAGKRSELLIVPQGDHYSEMLDQCVPQGINWLKQRVNELR